MLALPRTPLEFSAVFILVTILLWLFQLPQLPFLSIYQRLKMMHHNHRHMIISKVPQSWQVHDGHGVSLVSSCKTQWPSPTGSLRWKSWESSHEISPWVPRSWASFSLLLFPYFRSLRCHSLISDMYHVLTALQLVPLIPSPEVLPAFNTGRDGVTNNWWRTRSP